MKNTKNGVLIRYLKSLYDKKLMLMAEHGTLSIMLRDDYPYISELFAALIARDLECFGELGELLRYLGADTAIDIRIRKQGYHGESIDKIVKSASEELRGEIDALERLHSLTDGPRVCEAAEKMRLEASENIKAFERILRS